MKLPRLSLVLTVVIVVAQLAIAQGNKQHVPASSIPAADLIQPADFAAALQSGTPKPLILQVGSRVLFAQAHITGSEFAGPANQPAGIDALKARVAALPKDGAIVLYCGCCPWERCPNIAAAYNLLRAEGFTNVKALYIADNFGNDWVNKGFPTEKGH
jgi:rhodanese-related sulfurtransferase